MTNVTLPIHLGVIVACLLLTTIRAAAGQDQGQKAFESTATQVREVWLLIRPTVKNIPSLAIAKAKAGLAKCDSEPTTSGYDIASYLKARAIILSNQKGAAEKQLISSITVSMAPENVLALMELHSDSLDKRKLFAECLAELVPMSMWRRQLDARQSQFIADIKPPRPDIATAANREELVEVAALLERAKLYDLAWRAYSEVVYTGFSPAWVKQRLEATWLSQKAAEHWFKAAECARKAGKQKLAWDYLMKAAVFGSDDLYRRAKETAQKWKNEANEDVDNGMEAMDRATSAKALAKAAKLYTEMNAHPRSLNLIDRHRELFDNPDALREEVLANWKAVVKDLSRAAEHVTLYGTQVYPDGDPAAVCIPWALSKKALDQVGKKCAGPSPVLLEKTNKEIRVVSGKKPFLITEKNQLGNWKSHSLKGKTPFLSMTITFFPDNVAVVNYHEKKKDDKKKTEQIKPAYALVWKMKDSAISITHPNQAKDEKGCPKIKLKGDQLEYVGTWKDKPFTVMLEREKRPLTQEEAKLCGKWSLLMSDANIDVQLFFSRYGTGAMFVLTEGTIEQPEQHQTFTYTRTKKGIAVKCEAWGEQDRIYTLTEEGHLETRDPESGQVHRFSKSSSKTAQE